MDGCVERRAKSIYGRDRDRMRDQETYRMFQQMTDAVSADQNRLAEGFALLRTRVDALESLFLGSRFGLLKVMLMQLISPKRVAWLVRVKHQEQISKFNAAREAALRARSKIKAVQPSIIKAV